MIVSNLLPKYKQAILALPADRVLTRDDLLVDDFLLERHGKLEMYYAPHNEYLHPGAKVFIVGLTPGWSQMQVAMEAAKAGLQAGLPDEDVCRKAKEAASFAGTMRSHLIAMLDALELHRCLGLQTCGELFLERRELLHTTSVLRFPVFVGKANYTGAQPPLLANAFLKQAALISVQAELHAMKQALVIPLGRTVERLLELFVQDGQLAAGQLLQGFPHPSGANGHRHKQFAEQQEQMKLRIRQWNWG